MRLVLPQSRYLQNPLVRILAAVLGLAIMATLVVFGLFALAILVAGGLLWYAWFRFKLYRARKRGDGDPDRRPTDPDVIEGEYVVIDEPHRERN